MNTRPNPSRAQQHWRAGVVHANAQRWPAAALEFKRASTLAPEDALVWINLSRAQSRTQQTEAAIESARVAFDLDPGSALACRMLADLYLAQHRYNDAVACFERLLPQAERDHEFLSAHGLALFSVGRLPEAIDRFFGALALKLDAPLVHHRMGLAFKDLNMQAEAAECFRTAAVLDDGSIRTMALAMLVHESAQACQWSARAEESTALRDSIGKLNAAGGSLLSPFAFLAIDCTPAEQRKVGALRSNALGATVPRLPEMPARRSPGRIRVGYLSSDFCSHATAVLMAELLEQRDASTFEVVLYSHSRQDGTQLQRRVTAACDRLVDVGTLDNAALARTIRADDIDILVDLKGHTRDSRFEVLAARPARVQASYLGYPGTTGADYIDYIIGDPVVTPLSAELDFSEKIAQMPWSYQPNDRQRPLPPSPGRAACGLPEDALVMCSFNQIYKINPAVMDAWARILAGAPNALLWLLAWNDQGERNLRAELQRRGVEPGRVQFAPKALLSEHIARLRCADLFLDTWPCNAHTTASDALWAGVPVLTLPGPTFASRVAASLARATATDSLVTRSVDEYVARALELARDRAALDAIRQRLDEERMSLPLFDSRATARELEGLYLRMHERAERGLKADHLPARNPAQPDA